jgi:5-methylcytosine-specific restriction endonuclease McrA
VSSVEEELVIPSNTRQWVIDRDASVCRFCGQHVEVPHVHHIIYRSQGGLNLPSNLISLDFRCHMRVHDNKPLWLPIMQQLTKTPGVNGLQLLRWYRAKESKQ